VFFAKSLARKGDFDAKKWGLKAKIGEAGSALPGYKGLEV